VCRARIAAEIGNLRGALDWYIERDDAASALTLTTRQVWIWFHRTDFLQGVRWLEDALGVPGDAPTTLRATAAAFHGYCNAWITGSAVALAELREAVEVLRDGSDPEQLADALLIYADLLNRYGHIAATPVVLAEAHGVLSAIGDRWGLATHDLFTAGYLAPTGDLAAAEASVRSAIAGFESIGEQFLVLESRGMLAGVAEARGDLEGAATNYARLLEGARVSGLTNLIPVWLIRLGALRARQEDDATAVQLFAEAVARSAGPTIRGTALVGLAGATRRLGDAEPAQRLLDQAAAEYASVDHEDGRVVVLTAWCWSAIAVGDLDRAAEFADEACRGPSHDDRSMRMSAQIAAAAVAAAESGSEGDIEQFDALVRQRRGSDAGRFAVATVGTVGSTLDEPDVAGMCRTLGLESVSR
jgi:hypothetical protein